MAKWKYRSHESSCHGYVSWFTGWRVEEFEADGSHFNSCIRMTHEIWVRQVAPYLRCNSKINSATDPLLESNFKKETQMFVLRIWSRTLPELICSLATSKFLIGLTVLKFFYGERRFEKIWRWNMSCVLSLKLSYTNK